MEPKSEVDARVTKFGRSSNVNASVNIESDVYLPDDMDIVVSDENSNELNI